MPARVSSMDLSSTEAESRGPTRRKSGRVIRKPDTLISSIATKRKRGEDEIDYVEMEDASEAESEEQDEEDPDEEELKDRRRRAKKAKTSKSAAKKAKPTMNGQAHKALAIRPATGAPKARKKTKVQLSVDAESAGGLFGMNEPHSREIHPRPNKYMQLMFLREVNPLMTWRQTG
jgi:cohesin complex subunit SA-1/2